MPSPLPITAVVAPDDEVERRRSKQHEVGAVVTTHRVPARGDREIERDRAISAGWR
jgi:hypothetical protein